MESKVFSIGDIVALNSHPYLSENTSVIISGDHLALSPLMVVIEISKSSYKIDNVKHETYKYDCLWFSTKSYKFEISEIYEDQLKLIQKTSAADIEVLERGTRLNLKTVPLEMGKKKSILSYDDSSGSGNANTTINALLSFLPPVLQFVSLEPYTTKHPLKNKESIIREIPISAVRVTYFDPANHSVSEHVLPMEALTLIEKIPDKRLSSLQKIIERSGYIKIGIPGNTTLVKPKSIAYRGGYYFLRGFDYLSNRIEEFELNSSTKIKNIAKPVAIEAPKFDILNDPNSATSSFIMKEITDLINGAINERCYLRINYLNRNDQLTYRTVKKMLLVTVKENKEEVTYMIADCLLRMDKRTFRVDRIQSAQLLNLNYKA
ncbi:WYL domain-containing protein [Mucilaginibacter sp. Mucisp84]|uniref:WYL domain-containing protein n=1 Tax=Mucilaginibacter sp. Mucisp84 TaxID=3243058 RepID=UPI0039A415D0